MLMRGAGAFQENFQNYNPNDGHWYDFGQPADALNFGDQSPDQMSIHEGAQYYFRNPYRP